MNILITGNKGFIGTQLQAVFSRSHNVTGCDLKEGRDIRDRLKLDMLFETSHFDCVIHLAALTGVRRGELYPEEYISTNVIGTKNLLDFSEKYGVKHFIHFSSSSVYREQGREPLSEDAPLEPDSIYGMTKLMAEKVIQRSKVKAAIVRPFTVYADKGRPDQVPEKWIQQALLNKPISFYGDGTTGRGYTYLPDLVKGVEAILALQATGIFNLGGSQYITLAELWDICGRPERKVSPLPAGDRHGIYADITKARTALNWSPDTDFKQKVSEIWQFRTSLCYK